MPNASSRDNALGAPMHLDARAANDLGKVWREPRNRRRLVVAIVEDESHPLTEAYGITRRRPQIELAVTTG